MNRQITLLILIFISIGLIAQDTIVKVNGENIHCSVKEITPEIVRYKKSDNLKGPFYTIDLGEVMIIKYQNGARDVFNNQLKTDQLSENQLVLENNEPILSDDEMYKKGFSDANRYYSKYSGAGTGTLLTSLLLNGLFGLIPAIPCSAVPPKVKNLGYPSQNLMDNPSYFQGYLDGARKKKQKKVWMNWGIGTIISSTIIFISLIIQ